MAAAKKTTTKALTATLPTEVVSPTNLVYLGLFVLSIGWFWVGENYLLAPVFWFFESHFGLLNSGFTPWLPWVEVPIAAVFWVLGLWACLWLARWRKVVAWSRPVYHAVAAALIVFGLMVGGDMLIGAHTDIYSSDYQPYYLAGLIACVGLAWVVGAAVIGARGLKPAKRSKK
ncbi:MAG TPA: hypothetical protein VI322_00335 [Candidatus Saccharimonadia bacterium]